MKMQQHIMNKLQCITKQHQNNMKQETTKKGAHHTQVAAGHTTHAADASKNASKKHAEMHGGK